MKILFVVTIIILTVISSVPMHALALTPHENPNKVDETFDGAALFQEYSWALDYVSLRDIDKIQAQLYDLSLANIPPDLTITVQDYLTANQDLAQLLNSVELNIDTATNLLSQFDETTAMNILKTVESELPKGYMSLALAELKTQDTGTWWNVDSAPANSELRKAFDEVIGKLELQKKDLDSLAEQVKALESETVPPPEGKPKPTFISLTVNPTVAFVGDKVSVQGQVTSETKPLGGRKVTIFLDGSAALDIYTTASGNYQGELTLPYRYVTRMSVQAMYSPQSIDIGVYAGSISPTVTITTLFYETRLNLEVPPTVYPGRTFTLKGRFDYGNNPVPQTRLIQVTWNNELKPDQTVNESFSVELAVPADMSLGKNTVSVNVPAQQRYATGSFTAQVEVTKSAVFMDVNSPGMVLLPFGFTISGKVYSDLGPLNNATIDVSLGKWKATTHTAGDGTFKVHLNTGMSLTMFGGRKLEVTAVPNEPWNQAASTSPGLTVMNLVNIFGLVLTILVALFALYRLRKAFKRSVITSPQPAAATPEFVPVPEPQKETTEGPLSILIALYRQVLKLVQRVTAMILRPNQTLREFAQETSPHLGPLDKYFKEFTLMIERSLYSKHSTREEDVARGRELSKRLQEEKKKS